MSSQQMPPNGDVTKETDTTLRSVGRPASRLRRAVVAAVMTLMTFMVIVTACKSDPSSNPAGPGGPGAAYDGSTAAGCSPGQEGCACDQPGAVADCGQVKKVSGNYVTCSMGHATCTNGKWSTCAGDRLVTQSLPNRVLGLGGIHAQTTTVPCTNLCDPYCNSIAASNEDVDAAGIQGSADGGLTLIPDGSVSIDTQDASVCIGLQCRIVRCAQAGVTTTLSGTVYDPAGNNPLPNAFVYIPILPGVGLPPFSEGTSCDTCAGATLAALQVAQTGADGTFTLTNVPSGTNIPVVVQLGKWRREVVLSNINSCVPNTITNNCTTGNPADCVFRLPRNQRDGFDPVTGSYSKAEMPKVAIVTGSADPFDCLLLKAGIDQNEVGDYTSNKRVHFYQSDTKPGHTLNPANGMNVNGSVLTNSLNSGDPSMTNYDVILLPCEGAAVDKQGSTGTNRPYQNLIQYANTGGRAFATHFSYSWLAFPAFKNYGLPTDNWGAVANWAPTGSARTGSVNTQDPITGNIDTSFPKGQLYSDWMEIVGATTSPGRLTIHEGRQDLTTIGPNVQQWMSAFDTKYVPGLYSNLFTFNTPYNALPADQCGRIVFSDFHVSANANISGTSCISDVDCGFGATCAGAKQGATGRCNEPCQTPADCPNDTFNCNGSVPGTCQPNTCTTAADCGTGRACIGGVCSCAGDNECNGGTCGGKVCTVKNCTSSAQCGTGVCGSGTCNSVACRKDTDCGLGTCGGPGRTGTCGGGFGCHEDDDCGIGGTCGAGTSSTAGACSTNARACRVNGDCDSNACGSGTGAVKGVCANSTGKICHANADCDSNICGSGTGGAAGTCGRPGGTICHANSECDSNVCGSGTGGAAGTCATNAQACHVAADCDSASCGTGTGAVAGACGTNAQICHTNAQCDSGFCGTGTGSTAGTCGSSSQVCHTNANCDSNSCGVGTGSVKGVCTAGVCLSNAQCGTGGVCTLGRCTAGSCSLDTNCGTVGGVCTGATCSTLACALDSACTRSGVCNGAKCSTKTCAGDTACGVSRTCNGATCATKACANDAACGASGLCNNAKCSNSAACTSDAACPSSRLCNNAKCSTAATCAGDAGCPSSRTCTGATCGAKSCAGDQGCGVSNLCNGAKCSKSTCSNDSQCPLGVCTGAKCAPPPSCGSAADCGIGGTCTGSKCNVHTCNTNVDCGSGSICGGTCGVSTCTNNADCDNGVCVNGVCGCTTAESCGGALKCVGSASGTCGRACTTDAQCAPDRCFNGQCGGCKDSSECHDNSYTATCGGIPAANYGKCTSSTPNVFPGACKQGELSAQEKALEFMFFDLTACISADGLPPPPPPIVLPSYQPATFIEDFYSSCPVGTTVFWREFDWQAQIPNDAKIDFFAQTGADVASLIPTAPLAVGSATTTTNTGTGSNFDFALIDTGTITGSAGTGAFNRANPTIRSRQMLRMTITLNPASNKVEAPVLQKWKVQYDCIPSE